MEKSSIKKRSAKPIKNKSLNNYFILIILGIFFFSGLIFYLFFLPKISLIGDSYVTIEYPNKYVEKGFKAKLRDKDVTDKVWLTGSVDDTKVGIYKIKYKIRKNMFVITKVRTVEIKDTIKPEIELMGPRNIELCPLEKYKEEGYIASDNYDGDISSKVEVNQLEKEVVYQVKDSSNNEIVVKRIVTRTDNQKPTINIKSDKNIYVMLGETFETPRFSATDNCDGDVTKDVSVSGEVNSQEYGEYKLKYIVSDAKGNVSEEIVTVSVVDRIEPKPPIKGAIYLTFDDGPSHTITSKLLDILKEKDVKATFFVINGHSDLDHLIMREYDEGHAIALHSLTHNYAKVYSSEESFFNDLNGISNRVYDIIGKRVKITRFPGGSSNTISRNYNNGIMTRLTKSLLEQGYHYFDWNVSSGDAGGAKTKEEVYRNVTSNLSLNQANVVLFHDYEHNYKTLDAIGDIIDYGKENGYQFLTIDMSTAMVTHKVNN